MLLNEKVDARNSIQNKLHVLAPCGYSLNERRAGRKAADERGRWIQVSDWSLKASVRCGYYVEPSIKSA